MLAVLAVYGQTATHDFVNFDDDEYVYGNRHVQDGVTWASIAWAFTQARVAAHWHPLTWLSLMADAQVLKLNGGRPDRALMAAEMHGVNVALHAANAVLVFLLLRSMTASVWRRHCAAALFAVHPLHVESVAWVTERKDMLSGFFGLLAIWAYVTYARKPSAHRYALVAVALLLGLLAKPMLVTWPLLFLLLDYWPLKRWPSGGEGCSDGVHGGRSKPDGAPHRQLIVEKLPLLLLVTASAVVTFLAKRSSGTLASLEKAPLAARVARATVLYAAYLGKTVWPARLAAVYPDAPIRSAGPVVGAVTLLAVVTAVALLAARRGHRWAAVGWLWFLGTLVPTIGLVQAGLQVMADRFVYLPQIGLCVAAAWYAAELAGRSASGRRIGATMAAAILASLAACAWRQASVWHDSETLWNHTLTCTERNVAAHYNLGMALAERGKLDEAVVQYRQALVLKANMFEAHGKLGYALTCRGRVKEAIPHLEKAVELKADYAEALNNLAWLRSTSPDATVRNGDEAVRLALRAAELTPNRADALDTLAAAYAETRQFGKAVDAARKAVAQAEKANDRASAESIGFRLKLYEAEKPYRESQ